MVFRNLGKFKVITFILSFMLLIAVMPFISSAAVFAADPEELWVNGANIITADNNTVACGAGSAVYDAETGTLTLNDAVIEAAHYGNGIHKNGEFNASNVLTVTLVGINKITTNQTHIIEMGIYSPGVVHINGSGSLSITTAAGSDGIAPTGIYAFSGCTVTDSAILLKDVSDSVQGFSFGINVNSQTSSLIIEDAVVSSDGYVGGINVPAGHIIIENSTFTVNNAKTGISGGNEKKEFLIKDSRLDIAVVGEGSLGLLNGSEIKIDHSQVKIVSEKSNAVYTDGGITIKNGSDLDVTGYWPALFSVLDTTITDSVVLAEGTADSAIYSRANIIIGGTSDIEASGYYAGINANGNITVNGGKVHSVSSADIGIYLRGVFTVNGGEVYAKGAAGYAAIGARYTKQAGDVDPAGKIVINVNYSEIGGGRISVSDWYEGTTDGNPWTRSWSSFVGKDAAEELAADRSNALNEVTIKIMPADYAAVDTALSKIPADLTQYTAESVSALNTAKDAVVRGKNITEQSAVDGYASAIEAAVLALALKPVPVKYEVTKPAADNKWKKGDEGGMQITGNADFAKFTGLKVDGALVAAENYTASSGSTVVTLKSSYLETLIPGKHTVELVFTDGSAQTELTVLAKGMSGGVMAIIIIGSLLVCGAAVAGVILYRKKKKV